ncbi:alkyl hydroperoxide reductase AhpD [Sphaerisporangium krabiense]|uniref:AhpD family alkylhydroperoxidase n=1 Tax=Sphaerisporangium krabiense TaxID=763782 RepID=A0A7W8Z2M1_9ACTN|nr:carboxymuconolactone decarboxylase family protein [Sphaerisporangium krabiense]MBB5626276.1 AhpD family alkylhydroperoxidase [Sphaerisporangium krabiense]GII66060.1 alkyl hydroperoxide reductase AhpD [Sphaerisporangium krabiense]
MDARMNNPVMVLPDAMQGIQALIKAVGRGGVPQPTLELVHLRVSQINGCGVCLYGGVDSAKKAGETDERLHALAAWREAPFFDDAERAALALAEHGTRIADRSGDAVPEDVWDAAADHYDERQLSALLLMIGVTNLFNRLSATTKQPAGMTWA